MTKTKGFVISKVRKIDGIVEHLRHVNMTTSPILLYATMRNTLVLTS